MELRIAKFLMLVLVLTFGALAAAAGNDAKGGIYLKSTPDGSLELSNQSDDEQGGKPLVEASPASVPASASGVLGPKPAAGADASAQAGAATNEAIAWYGSVPASQLGDPEMASALPKIGAALLNSGNPAVGRRYLMMDRATYMKQSGGN